MEHIIQFGVTIDDDAIRKHVEERALGEVVRTISGEIKSNLPKTYGGHVDWNRVAYTCVEEFIDRNRDEVIEIAAEKLVEKVKRTKAWRERYGEALEGGE